MEHDLFSMSCFTIVTPKGISLITTGFYLKHNTEKESQIEWICWVILFWRLIFSSKLFLLCLCYMLPFHIFYTVSNKNIWEIINKQAPTSLFKPQALFNNNKQKNIRSKARMVKKSELLSFKFTIFFGANLNNNFLLQIWCAKATTASRRRATTKNTPHRTS